MTTGRVDDCEKAWASHNMITGSEAYARVAATVVRFPAVATFVIVKLVGGFCEEDACLKEFFFRDAATTEHGFKHDVV
jgi:hypothetical protein